MIASPDEQRAAFRRGAYGIVCMSMVLGPVVWLVTNGARWASDDRIDASATSCLALYSVLVGALMMLVALTEPTLRRRWESWPHAVFYVVVLTPRFADVYQLREIDLAVHSASLGVALVSVASFGLSVVVGCRPTR